MHMSSESLLIILLVGLIAGWLAGQIVRGTGFGIVGDLIIGIIGAFIGSWLLPQLGIHLGTGHHRGNHQRHDRRAGPAAGHQARAWRRRMARDVGGKRWETPASLAPNAAWRPFGRLDYGNVQHLVGAPAHRRHIGVAQQADTRRKTALSGDRIAGRARARSGIAAGNERPGAAPGHAGAGIRASADQRPASDFKSAVIAEPGRQDARRQPIN